MAGPLDFSGRGLRPFEVHIRDGDLCALTREGARDFPAETAGGARHDGDLIFHPHVEPPGHRRFR